MDGELKSSEKEDSEIAAVDKNEQKERRRTYMNSLTAALAFSISDKYSSNAVAECADNIDSGTLDDTS